MRLLAIAAAALVALSLTSCASAQSHHEIDYAKQADSSFEHGLAGFSLAGVGEVVPRIVQGSARTGTHAIRFELQGEENRSELILGGEGTGSSDGVIHFHNGDDYWYGFAFQIRHMTWGHPGAHNLIMQLFSESYGPNFGIQLWAENGEKGLYTHGLAMNGDRFLAPVALDRWHELQIHLRMSNDGHGSYAVYLDNRRVDSRTGVSTIHPGDPFAYIKTGLYRNGVTNPGRSTLLVDSVKLGETRASVLPG